jgi:hypothetical protein
MFEQIKLLRQVTLCVFNMSIRAVNGTSITTKQSFWKIYNGHEPGASVSITLLRNQHEQPFTFVKPKN